MFSELRCAGCYLQPRYNALTVRIEEWPRCAARRAMNADAAVPTRDAGFCQTLELVVHRCPGAGEADRS